MTTLVLYVTALDEHEAMSQALTTLADVGVRLVAMSQSADGYDVLVRAEPLPLLTSDLHWLVTIEL